MKNTGLLLFFLFWFLMPSYILAQNPCSGVTTLTYNLSSNPDSVIRVTTTRAGNCCSTTNCVVFAITLSPDAEAVSLGASGGLGGGVSVYKVNCGPNIAVGAQTCISGSGTQYITFCKPGDNAIEYIITSISKPRILKKPLYTTNGCKDSILITGVLKSSIVVESVGNNATYNSWLSAQTGKDTVIVTPPATGTLPPYVDYVVTGTRSNTLCGTQFNDTVRVYFSLDLTGSINAPITAVCSGQSTVLTAVPGLGFAPYSYLWSNAATTASINATAGTYTVTITDAKGCRKTTAPVVIGTSTKPIISITGKSSACNNDTIVFSQTSLTNHSYNWSVTGGSVYSGQSTNSITYINTTLGDQFIRLLLTNTTNGCFSYDSVKVTVNPIPGIPSATNVARCGPGTVTFVSSLGTNGVSNNWYSTAVSTGVLFNGSSFTTPSLSGTRFYFVASVGVGGCIGPRFQVTVTINSLPNISIPNIDTCQGISKTLIASPSGGTTPYSYSWSVPAGQSAPGNVSTFTASVAGSYSIILSDTKGCKANASATFTHNPLPLVSLPAIDTCFGISKTLQAFGSSGTPSYNYSWTVPSGQSAPGNVSSFVATVIGTYSIILTDTKGCRANSTSTTFTYNSLPIISLPAIDTCAGLSKTIVAAVSNGTSPYTYFWTTPSGQSSPGNVASFLASVAGAYSTMVTDNKGCIGNASTSFTHNPLPLVTLPPIDTCQGYSKTIKAISSGGTTPYTYNWSVPVGQASPGNVSTFLASVYGTYSIVVTDRKGCTANANSLFANNPAPVIYIPPVSTCERISALITANVSSGTPTYALSWSVPFGMNNPGNTSSFYTIFGGTYTATVTDSKGCKVTGSGILTVNTNPEVTLHYELTCEGAPTSLKSSIRNGTSPFTYYWDVPSGVANPGNVDSFMVNNPGFYLLDVVDQKGCLGRFVKSVTFEKYPTPSIVGIDSICTNKLYNYGVNNTSGNTYSWSISNGSIGTGQATSAVGIKVLTPGWSSLSIEESSPIGCKIIDVKNIQIAPSPNTSPIKKR